MRSAAALVAGQQSANLKWHVHLDDTPTNLTQSASVVMRIREIAWLRSSARSLLYRVLHPLCRSIDCCSATNLPDSIERRGYHNWLVRVECAAPDDAQTRC